MRILYALVISGTAWLRASDVALSPEEKTFLQAHPVWRMAGASAPPFQWTDEKGQFQGLSRDYRAIIEGRLGIRLEVVPAPTWEASLEMLKRKECDVSLLTADTPARREFLAFTEPLVSFPVKIIARRQSRQLDGLNDLAGLRVAVARERPIHEKLTADYPQVSLLPRDDVGSAISAVALGDADAYVGDMASALDAIDRLGVRNLKIVGAVPEVFAFRIGIRKDWPQALSLLEKVVASITADEHAAIRRKWIVGPGDEWPVKRVLMFAIPTVIGLVMLTLLIVNQRLSREVARRKKTEAALRESEERWSFALEGSGDGVWDWDLATDQVFFSKRFREMLEFSDEEIEGRFNSWKSRIHPEDLERVLGAMDRHLRGETAAYAVEHRLLMKDGTTRWILSRGLVVARDNSGRPLRVVGTHTDVTKRKELDLELQRHLEDTVRVRSKALERAERGLQQITAKIPGAVYQFAKRIDGTFAFTFCSERMESLVGVTPAEALRDVETVWAVIHPDDLTVLVKKANHSAETLTEYVQDLRIVQPDGRTWWIRAEAVPQRQADGSTLWNGNIMDITERKRLEEELAKSKQAADSANRAKSIFLANMSHEIRTPMNGILGFAQLLMRGDGLTAEQRKHLQTITRSGEHLLAVINDILEISKIEAGRVALQLKNFDLRVMLDDLDQLFRMRAEARGLRFTIACNDSVPRYLRADESKLRQVLINLVSNAVKFTERGGITVRMRAQPEFENALRLECDVEDTGVGIDPADQLRLFRQFEQTEAGRMAGMGTGLGLAISRHFVRMMGGDISVSSAVGKGSTFRFDLIAQEGSVVASAQVDRRRVRRLQPGYAGMRVLIADDKAENRQLLEHLLQPAGFETRAVEDGVRAVEVFGEWRPHVGLFDLRMPRMDGFEAIRRIRTLPDGAQAKIIAVTASAFEENRREVIEAGGDDFLGKPFRDEDLFERIARLTGAEYEYDEENAVTEEASGESAAPIPTAELAAAIPATLRAQLAEAALRADFDSMLELIGKVDELSPAMARELRRRVECYEYEVLIELAPGESMVK